MPTYSFENEKSGEQKEVLITYEEKQKFLKDNPDWKYVIAAPGLSYQGAVSPIKKAGTEWNDVLKNIKKNSAKDNTIAID